MWHGHGPAQLPGWFAKYWGTWAQGIITTSNLPWARAWQTWHWPTGVGVGVDVAKTGSVIAKKTKVIATQTNIAASVFLNSVE